MLSRAARQVSYRAASCAWTQAGAVATCSNSSSSSYASSLTPRTSLHTRHVSSSKIPAVQLELMRWASSYSSRHTVPCHRSRADDCILQESCVRPRGFRTTAHLRSTPPMFRLAGTTYTFSNELRDYKQQGGAPASFVRAFGGQSVVPWELALFLVEEVGFGLLWA